MDLNTQDGSTAKTAFVRAVEFLRRDVRSFLPSWKHPEGAEQETAITGSPDLTLPSFVDFGTVDYLAFRREVLDWRDGFHARVTVTAIALRDSFARRIRRDLADVSILRRVLTRPAYEMLQNPFIQVVRVPMMAAVQREQLKLDEMAKKWLLQAPRDLTFPTLWSESECRCLGDIDFTPKNEKRILEKIEALILGDNGVVDRYRTHATNIARRMIEERTQ